MASIGPSMPPHLAKRKRTPDDGEAEGSPSPKHARNADEIDLGSDGSDDENYGPAAPLASKPPAGPTLPPAAPARTNNDEIDLDGSDDDDGYGPSALAPAPAPAPSSAPAPAAKPPIGPSMPPKRTIGPSLPPPDAVTTSNASPDSDSDSDSDYGPAPPSADPSAPQTSVFDRPSSRPSEDAPAPTRRDDWMLAPPTSSGYNERDPSKLKARRFASNKPHASAPSAGASEISSIWTETPEQKRKRLEDAVLGRAAPAGSDLEAAERQAGGAAAAARARDEELRYRRTSENLAAARGKSLYDEHQSDRRQGRSEGKDVEEEDDPSKRAFDREKDMGLGGRISTAQRRELLTKAKDFGGRFQKGSFL